MITEYPVTLWQSTLGTGDGQDMATRGYLRALMEIGYEYVVVLPRGSHVEHLDEPWVQPFLPILGYPKKFDAPPLKRIQEGDPRIGKPWKHLEDASERVLQVPAPTHAPAGTPPTKWDTRVAVGEVDQDYYREHPEERQPRGKARTELLVVHVDPNRLARTRDQLARDSQGEVPIVGITAWEADRVPAALAQQLSDLDCLIVPSDHTARAFRKSGLDPECPVRVVPHALTMPRLSDEEYSKSVNNPSTRYVFYTVASDIPRKNLRGLIAAYCRAFAPRFENVGLVIKTGGDKDALKALYNEGCELGSTRVWPKIALYGDRWSDEKIRQLHLQGNCFVSATRGEGFGLGEAEAALMGNPVVSTGWGAVPEVLDLPGMMLTKVGYDLVAVDEDMSAYGAYAPDQQWAEPHIDELADAMRRCAVERWPKSLAQARVLEKTYSLKRVGGKLASALKVAK